MTRFLAPIVRLAVLHKYRQGEATYAHRSQERIAKAMPARPDGPLIWVHAASLGEASSIFRLVERLSDKRPEWMFLITCWTETASAAIQRRLSDNILHQFVPLDLPKSRKAFLNHWQPDACLFVESEIWPGFIHEINRGGIPLVLINARLSKRATKGWMRFRNLARYLFGAFDQILSQGAPSAARLKELGAHKNRINIIGDLKSASPAPPADPEEVTYFKELFGKRPIWIAASTHPGEEEIILKAHQEALDQHPDLLLILIPRHPRRNHEIVEIIREGAFTYSLRSKAERPDSSTQIYLADTLGDMGLWYRLAPLVFIGGSLVDVGGHNPFEPARLGTAILVGPHFINFRSGYEALFSRNAAKKVSGEMLGAEIANLIRTEELKSMAQKAQAYGDSLHEIDKNATELLLTGALKELSNSAGKG